MWLHNHRWPKSMLGSLQARPSATKCVALCSCVNRIGPELLQIVCDWKKCAFLKQLTKPSSVVHLLVKMWFSDSQSRVWCGVAENGTHSSTLRKSIAVYGAKTKWLHFEHVIIARILQIGGSMKCKIFDIFCMDCVRDRRRYKQFWTVLEFLLLLLFSLDLFECWDVCGISRRQLSLAQSKPFTASAYGTRL